jgi:hypothetical protein
MSSEMKFKDAGKKPDMGVLDAPAPKIYPRFTVDLDQFPGLECEVDETVELHLRGRVCARNHNDWGNTMDVEVTSIAVPSHTHDSIGPKNEADSALGKMLSPRRIG